MPRREPLAALLHGQIPLSEGDHLARLVDRLYVPLGGIVEQVVAVGVVPPLTQAGGVWEQPQHLGGAEGCVPELGDVGDVGSGDRFQAESVVGCHFAVWQCILGCWRVYEL